MGSRRSQGAVRGIRAALGSVLNVSFGVSSCFCWTVCGCGCIWETIYSHPAPVFHSLVYICWKWVFLVALAQSLWTVCETIEVVVVQSNMVRQKRDRVKRKEEVSRTVESKSFLWRVKAARTDISAIRKQLIGLYCQGWQCWSVCLLSARLAGGNLNNFQLAAVCWQRSSRPRAFPWADSAFASFPCRWFLFL